MSVLKKLVCRRVHSDNGVGGGSRGYNNDDSTLLWDNHVHSINPSAKSFYMDRSRSQKSTTTLQVPSSSCKKLNGWFSAQEQIPPSIEHQMEELDAFAKLAGDHFRESIAITRPEEIQSSFPENIDNQTYIVKQIQKSLRPSRCQDGRRGSRRGKVLKKQFSLQQFRIGRTRTKNSNDALPKPADGSRTNDMSRRKGCKTEVEVNWENMDENIPRQNVTLRMDSELVCNDSLQLHGLPRGFPFEQRDDLNGKRNRTESQPKSLRCTKHKAISSGQASGVKRTRFADDLEQRFFLPPVQDMESQGNFPSRPLGHIPNANVGKSILRPSTPLNCRYYMSTDTETKCGCNDDEEVFDWKDEQASTIVADDQTDMSSELSFDDSSHNSLGSVELLFNLLFCSPVDSLSRSDWLR